jgi:hypothetical protein
MRRRSCHAAWQQREMSLGAHRIRRPAQARVRPAATSKGHELGWIANKNEVLRDTPYDNLDMITVMRFPGVSAIGTPRYVEEARLMNIFNSQFGS